MGNLEVANNVSFPGQAEFREKELAPFIFNGTEMGAVKAVDNFTFLKVKEAGHTLPYWRELGHFLFNYALLFYCY